MEPKNFKKSTIHLKKPLSMTDEDCYNLWIDQSDEGQCISLWTTSIWKRIKFLFHGKLWLCILSGKNQPPVWLDMTKTLLIKKKIN